VDLPNLDGHPEFQSQNCEDTVLADYPGTSDALGDAEQSACMINFTKASTNFLLGHEQSNWWLSQTSLRKILFCWLFYRADWMV
jgi:hypothetical protein